MNPELSTEDVRRDSTIYHYLDFAKLVSILQEKSLYFTHVSAFAGDPEEGRDHDRRLYMEDWRDSQDESEEKWDFYLGKDDEQFQEFKDNLETDRQRWIREYEELEGQENTARSKAAHCWTLDDELSDLMWLSYARFYGVAIESTVKDLQDSFADKTGLEYGKVTYYEPAKARSLSFLKRPRFHREQEYRVVCPDPDGNGVGRNVDLSKLIGTIWISPHVADKWFSKVVRSELQHYGLPQVAVRSDSLYHRGRPFRLHWTDLPH